MIVFLHRSLECLVLDLTKAPYTLTPDVSLCKAVGSHNKRTHLAARQWESKGQRNKDEGFKSYSTYIPIRYMYLLPTCRYPHVDSKYVVDW